MYVPSSSRYYGSFSGSGSGSPTHNISYEPSLSLHDNNIRYILRDSSLVLESSYVITQIPTHDIHAPSFECIPPLVVLIPCRQGLTLNI